MGAIAFAQSFPEPSETVEVHVVEGAHYQPVQKVYAEVVAPRRLGLRTELTGVVAEVGFAAGDAVEKDQLLLQQDVREEKARLRALKARELLAARTFSVLGHFPLVLVTGAGAEARNSIGIILVAGMMIGTLFTLVVLLCVYLWLAEEHEPEDIESAPKIAPG